MQTPTPSPHAFVAVAGEIPAALGSLTKLERLCLDHNKLGGKSRTEQEWFGFSRSQREDNEIRWDLDRIPKGPLHPFILEGEV